MIKPNRIRLREGIRQISDQDGLTPDQLARLQALAQGAPAQASRRRWLSAAAGLAAVGVASYFGLASIGRSSNLRQMAEEVAGNHLRASPLDLLTADLDQARESFAALGFHLLDAAEIEDVPGQLLGARFCSIASVPAALLRYQDGARHYTVYQARFSRTHHQGAADIDQGQAPAVRHIGGVAVCICHTQGILLAVASGGATAHV
ncbi:MAG: hypothetical protein ACXIUM_07205 [Wenzhouxiangella sp.]